MRFFGVCSRSVFVGGFIGGSLEHEELSSRSA
jgi:hypothetical protein